MKNVFQQENILQQKHKGLFSILLLLCPLFFLNGCGRLIGIPAHGGGKRFAVEQRLVSASIRSALDDIDLSSLKGKRVALIFDLVNDEGGGNLSGGRLSLSTALSLGYIVGPTTATNSVFQVFNLKDSASSYSNTYSGNSVDAATTTASHGNTATNSSISGYSDTESNSTGNNSSTTNSSGSSTNNTITNGSSNDSSTTSGTGITSDSSSNTTVTVGANNSSGNNTTATGGIVTNGNYTENGNSSNTTTANGTSSGSSSQNSTTTGSGSSTSTSNSNGSSTTASSTSGANASSATSNTDHGENSTGDSATATNSSSNQVSNSSTTSITASGSKQNHQRISPSPVYTESKTRGIKSDSTASLVYRGLGEYHNFNVPKSDASLLMGLTRDHLLLHKVFPTTPSANDADVFLYVTVDVFGLVRSRFDVLIYNNERLKAETSFEMMAFDQRGELIMAPQSSDRIAEYIEHYLFWVGPVHTKENLYKGKGLLFDFSKVGIAKEARNAKDGENGKGDDHTSYNK